MALCGIAAWVSRVQTEERLSCGQQLGILRRQPVLLQVLIIVLIFAAMFTGYSYFAEFLGTLSGISAATVNELLVLFAVAPHAWAVGLLVIPWGLILGQTVIAREFTSAPVFGNSLFASTSNEGIALGSAAGVVQLALVGTRSIMLLGGTVADGAMVVYVAGQLRRAGTSLG